MQITQVRCILCKHIFRYGYYCCHKDSAICIDCFCKNEKCPKCHKLFKLENKVSSRDILKERNSPQKQRPNKILDARGYNQCCKCHEHKHFQKQMFLEANCEEKICQKCIRQSLSRQQISFYAILPCRGKCKYQVTQISLFLKNFCLKCMKNCQHYFYDLLDQRKICRSCLLQLKYANNMEDKKLYNSIKKLMLNCANCERQIQNQRDIGFHDDITYICKLCCDLNKFGQEMRERKKGYKVQKHENQFSQYKKRKRSISPQNLKEYKKQKCNQCQKIIYATQECYNWNNKILCSLCYSNINQLQLKKSSLNDQKSIINMNKSLNDIQIHSNLNRIKSSKEKIQSDKNNNEIQFQQKKYKLGNKNNKYNKQQQQQNYFLEDKIYNNKLRQVQYKNQKPKLSLSSNQYLMTIKNTNLNNETKIKQHQQEQQLYNINSMTKLKQYKIQPNYYYEQVLNQEHEKEEQEEDNINQDNDQAHKYINTNTNLHRNQENQNNHTNSTISTKYRRIQQSQIKNNNINKSIFPSEIEMNQKVYCEKCGKGMNISIAIWQDKNGQEIVICNACQLNISVNQ